MNNKTFKNKTFLNKVAMLRDNLFKRGIELTDHQLNIIINTLNLTKHYYLFVYINEEDFNNKINEICEKSGTVIKQNDFNKSLEDNCLVYLYNKTRGNFKIIIALHLNFTTEQNYDILKDTQYASLIIGKWSENSETL